MSLATIPISDRLPASTRIYEDHARALMKTLEDVCVCVEKGRDIVFGSQLHRDLITAQIIARQTVEDFGKAGG